MVNGCTTVVVSLVAYTQENANAQWQLTGSPGGTFGPGSHTLTVPVPTCLDLIDFVTGQPMTTPGGYGSRLISELSGGAACTTTTTTTPPPSGGTEVIIIENGGTTTVTPPNSVLGIQTPPAAIGSVTPIVETVTRTITETLGNAANLPNNVLGFVNGLPSTTTSGGANLPIAGIALLAAGLLLVRRWDKRIR